MLLSGRCLDAETTLLCKYFVEAAYLSIQGTELVLKTCKNMFTTLAMN